MCREVKRILIEARHVESLDRGERRESQQRLLDVLESGMSFRALFGQEPRQNGVKVDLSTPRG